MKTKLLFFLSIIIYTLTFLQPNVNDGGEQISHRHQISAMVLTTYIPKGEKDDKRGIFGSNIGLEYGYEINHQWAIDIIGNLELKEYAVNIDDELVFNDNEYQIPHFGIVGPGCID